MFRVNKVRSGLFGRIVKIGQVTKEDRCQEIVRKIKRTKQLVGTGRLPSLLDLFHTQSSSDITGEQIQNEIVKPTGDGSYMVEKLARNESCSAFKVTVQVNRLKSPDIPVAAPFFIWFS